jgi:hypothetical protein
VVENPGNASAGSSAGVKSQTAPVLRLGFYLHRGGHDDGASCCSARDCEEFRLNLALERLHRFQVDATLEVFKGQGRFLRGDAGKLCGEAGGGDKPHSSVLAWVPMSGESTLHFLAMRDRSVRHEKINGARRPLRGDPPSADVVLGNLTLVQDHLDDVLMPRKPTLLREFEFFLGYATVAAGRIATSRCARRWPTGGGESGDTHADGHAQIGRQTIESGCVRGPYSE